MARAPAPKIPHLVSLPEAALLVASLGRDGLFRAATPLPAPALRGTNRARYRAPLGGERSLRLNLAQYVDIG